MVLLSRCRRLVEGMGRWVWDWEVAGYLGVQNECHLGFVRDGCDVKEGLNTR